MQEEEEGLALELVGFFPIPLFYQTMHHFIIALRLSLYGKINHRLNIIERK
jgi:uncharacterized membrane protein YiaA